MAKDGDERVEREKHFPSSKVSLRGKACQAVGRHPEPPIVEARPAGNIGHTNAQSVLYF
jgi:hypothetical protein